MIVLGIIAALLLLLGFTRVGVRAVRAPDGQARLTMRIGFLRFNLLKMFAKAEKRPDKPRKAKKKPEKEVKRRFSWDDAPIFMEAGTKILRKLRRGVRIDRMNLQIIFGGPDPCDTAMTYSRSHIALGALRPAIHMLRVKKQEIIFSLDLAREETQWSGDLIVTASIGRLTLIGFSLLGIMIKLSRKAV